MTPADRMKLVRKWKLCDTCLNDHGHAECKFRMRCTIGGCMERHNPLLHQGSGMVVMNAHIRLNSSILFRMLPVTLYFRDKSVTTLAFLDEGASVTMVEKALADQLGAEGVRQRLEIRWTGDVARVEKDSRRISLKISAVGGTQQLLMNEVCTVGELALPEQSLDAREMVHRYEHLRGLPVTSYRRNRPRILIGLNNIHTMAPIDARLGEPGEPIAVKSPLGWTIYGPRRGAKSSDAHMVGYHDEISNEQIHDLIKRQYALEESVICRLKESAEDRKARDILETTTVRVGERFETGLLWKSDNPQFPDSYPMALRRCKQLDNRLNKNPTLRETVRRQIMEYQEKGYAHQATTEELNNANPSKVWYIPLDVVVNPMKGKVRLVWDGRASVKGISLNSQLMKGPDMLASLPAVINRFRERRVGFGGDIKEMYHQIKIRKEDKSAQRFLFRAVEGEAPKVYVMDVATFGSTCSPSSAQFIKNKNALEFAAEFPEAAEALRRRLLR
ncbi:uncharacterized protein LOC134209104 [Armigeres subalbatus]|uniref:uncharacterized protein LOC134209104 n=1 Tax=Armigeres subalbatus TaxID=124917 RepID=UPI002ED61075